MTGSENERAMCCDELASQVLLYRALQHRGENAGRMGPPGCNSEAGSLSWKEISASVRASGVPDTGPRSATRAAGVLCGQLVRTTVCKGERTVSIEPTDLQAWPPEVPLISPSLLPDAMTGACYEVKFLVTPEQAEHITACLARHLHRDPHAESGREGAYRVQSLYLDTPAFDVYYRSEGYRRQKFRLRRYGEEPVLYLECKTRTGEQVHKERTRVGMDALARLSAGEDTAEWPGAWFQHNLRERHLVPCALIRYERSAFTGQSDDGPIRVTLDRQIACVPVSRYLMESACEGTRLLAGWVVLELKFRVAMPALFKRLVRDHGLTPCDVSKYRRGVEACALVPGSRKPPDA